MRFKSQLTNILTFTSTSSIWPIRHHMASHGITTTTIGTAANNYRTNGLPHLPGQSLLATTRRQYRPLHHHPRPGHSSLGSIACGTPPSPTNRISKGQTAKKKKAKKKKKKRKKEKRKGAECDRTPSSMKQPTTSNPTPAS